MKDPMNKTWDHGFASLAAISARIADRLSNAVRGAQWKERLFLWSGAAAVLLCSVALLIPTAITAQVQNGTITGVVTDPTGAFLTGAPVTAIQKSTGLVIRSRTNSDGTYVLPQLQPDTYSVAVEQHGFKKTEVTITLTVGEVARVDLQVPLGSESETVTVQAETAAELDAQTSELDYTVGTKQVDELPLNGRNVFSLATLTPGIAAGTYFGQGLSITRPAVVAAATNNFEANGGIGGSNAVLLDGAPIEVCCQGQPAVTPTIETLGQFLVITSDPPAEYGRSSGGILNIVTKQGANRVHGDVYEFLRNDALDAANFFTKRSGIYPFPGRADYTLPHRFNQFGAFMSGPVVLPHIYRGIDKTFFTFGYEGTRNLAPTYQTTTVPTNLMRQGIFTEAPALIYNPLSSSSAAVPRTPIPAACNGSTCYAAGQYIPTIDPVAKALLPLIPPQNAPGVSNNYDYSTNIVLSDDQFNFRLDHNFSANQRAFIRGTRDINSYQQYDLFNQPHGPNSNHQALTAYLFSLGYLKTISGSTFLQATYGFARQNTYEPCGNYFGFDSSNYGFSSQFASQQQVSGLPIISFSSLATLGCSSSINLWEHAAHALNGTVIMQRGKHSLTAGYNGQLILENEQSMSNGVGSFSFGTTFTNGPNPNGAVPSGQSPFDAWASFLLGYPTSGSLTRQATVAFSQYYNAVFLQDDWRLTQKLVLNLGVRWGIETGFKERDDRWADFNPNAANPLAAYTALPITGGAQYLGTAGNPGRTWSTFYDKVEPRLGLSYAVTPKTVLRGGYSIMYLPDTEHLYNNSTMGFSQTTTMLTTVNGFTPVNTIDNPFPSGVLLPAGAAAGVTVSTGSSASAYVYNNPTSYQQQWNFGIEQALAKGMKFNLNYTGGHGVKLPINATPNDLNPKYFGAPGNQAQVAYLQSLVTNPFYGSSSVAAGSALANPTVQQGQLLAAFPQYISNTALHNTSLTYLSQDSGSATYDAMQAAVIVNHPNGLSGSAAFTWSKLLGNVSDLTNGFLNPSGNPGIQNYYLMHQYEHSNLATDIPIRVVGNLTYALPFGRGMRFGSGMPRWEDELAGGWNVTSIIAVQSGYPLGLTQTGGQAFSGARPTYVPGVSPLTSGSDHHRLGGAGQTQAYFNPSAFQLSQSFQLGDVPRSAGALRSPRSFQDDVSAVKNFTIHEDLQGELRFEAFNVLNKVDFGAPNTTVGSSTFGYITSQANLPRNIQVALKIHF